MPRFILEIELGNDAMQTGYDVMCALSVVARNGLYRDEILSAKTTEGNKIRDRNGNTVGHYEVRQ